MLSQMHPVGRARPSTSSRGAVRRRGVLLLVVLSLLVLFSLMGLTFLLVAGRYYKTTKRSLSNEQVGSNPRSLCDEVLAQVVRGTNNPHSAIRTHDLLGDMYGNDGVVLNSSSATISAHPMQLTSRGTTSNLSIWYLRHHRGDAGERSEPWHGTDDYTVGQNYPLTRRRCQHRPGYFNGCVLTFLDGRRRDAARGSSAGLPTTRQTRIAT